MKTLIIAFFTMTSMTAFSQTSYSVSPSDSKITYVGKKVTGMHTGNITIKSGTLIFKGEELSGGEIVADMNTITSTDLTDPEDNKEYVDHIKSPDFFNTKKYEEAKIVIKSSKKTDKGLEVTGALTMIGEERPITFIVKDLKKTDSNISASTNLQINRTKWGLKYGSGSFFKGLGDKAINDEFSLTVNLNAKK